MEIRCANMDCFEIVESITQRTIKEIYPHYYAKGAVEFFLSHHNTNNIKKDIESEQVFLIYDDTIPTGTVTIKENEICRLFVLPHYQKQGYGKKLIEYAESMISKHYDTITLDSSLPAKAMYKRRGYSEIETHSIHIENDDYLCYDVMQKNVTSSFYKINYDDKYFLIKQNSDNGEVNNQTIFHYHQKENIIWADYAGGEIVKGYLVGTVDYNGNLNFSYQHVNDKQQIRIGICASNPIVLDNGKLELHEKWQWLNEDKSKGDSILIEK